MSVILHPLHALYWISRIAGVCCMFYGVGSSVYPAKGFDFLILGVASFYIPKGWILHVIPVRRCHAASRLLIGIQERRVSSQRGQEMVLPRSFRIDDGHSLSNPAVNG